MHHLWLAVQSLSSAQDVPEGRVRGAHVTRYAVDTQDDGYVDLGLQDCSTL